MKHRSLLLITLWLWSVTVLATDDDTGIYRTVIWRGVPLSMSMAVGQEKILAFREAVPGSVPRELIGIVRGEAVAGYSDLDFWIFLDTAVFHDETRFKTALQTIIDAHHQLDGRGIPVSNAGCYASQANIARLPAMLLPNLQSETASRVILGQNIRQQMQTTPETIKYVPEAVCAALDLWPGEHGAIAALAELWPDEDWDTVARVKSFCAQHGPAADKTQLLANLWQMMLFIERLNDKLVAHIMADGR